MSYGSPTSKSPLHFLAYVALDMSEKCSGAGTPATGSSKQKGVSYPCSTTSSPTPSLLANLHIPCSHSDTAYADPKPLRRSSTSNSLHTTDSSSSVSGRVTNSSKKHRRKAMHSLQKVRADLKVKRRECMERASKIKSLENSPVNDRQLLVLRMVYDEITMYPSEAWMVLIAIIINRAPKQVKNWFSNERQKQKSGEVVSIRTVTGEKLRLRAQALQQCQDWSDSFFEEVVMVHNFKVLRRLRWRETQLGAPRLY